MPILGLFGEDDGGIPIEQVREFESILNDLGKDVEVHIYPNANHAFANPSGGRYNAEAAEDAWNRTVAFFADNLK
jgi:carboxymethylenebutenolidase